VLWAPLHHMLSCTSLTHLHILARKAWPCLLCEPARIIHWGQQGEPVLQADLKEGQLAGKE
jgi:hypothetical protein